MPTGIQRIMTKRTIFYLTLNQLSVDQFSLSFFRKALAFFKYINVISQPHDLRKTVTNAISCYDNSSKRKKKRNKNTHLSRTSIIISSRWSTQILKIIERIEGIDYRCEDGRFPVVYLSASCVPISNPKSLPSNGTGVNPGIRSWKMHVTDWAECQNVTGVSTSL
jgi:hypothetical protein